jgi:hypothetical protein
MSKVLVPEVSRGRAGEECRRRRWRQRVQLALAVTSENLHAGGKVLNRETKRVKFNGYIIVSSERSNGNQVLNERRRNQNIVEKKW